MSQPTQTPTLTPQFCFNERALREFFRLSRTAIDDTISTHLNSLLTPSTTNPFPPITSSPTFASPERSSPRGRLPTDACKSFLHQILFPTWSSRSKVLAYCTSVSQLPDPSLPALRDLDSEAEAQAQKPRIVDERLDPYSARTPLPARQDRTERLKDVLRLEGGVERIVRARVWGVVQERCGGVFGEEEQSGYGGLGAREAWEVAMDKWREGQQEGKRK